MKKLLIPGLIVLSACVGIAMFWRGQRFSPDLQHARESVGTKQGGLLLEELARSHPKDAEIQFLQARQLRLQGGDHTRALACCQRAADLGYPSDQVARETLLIKASQEFQQLEPDLQRLLDTNPNDQEVVLTLALGWSRLGNFSKAEALVNGVLERAPESGAGHWVRGTIQMQRHQPHDARPDLEQAVRAGPNQYYYSRARYQLANCYLELGKFEDALELYRQCLADEPDSPRAFFGIGRCCWYLNQWNEAGEAFREVLRRRPDHLDALSQLAYIYEEHGKPADLSQAMELLERAAQLDPKWYDLHFRMAKIFKALGQDQRAAQHYRRAEQVKKAWAKPRNNPFTGRNPYAGDEPGMPRNPLDD
jgi:tetratricopeptide (TPR) repeat protein